MKSIETNRDIQTALKFLIENDPRLRAIAAEAGEVPLRRRTADFEGLAQIVVSQLVSVASATAIFERLRTLVSPLTAERLNDFSDEQLAAAGLSRPKIKTLRAAAHALTNGLNIDDLIVENAKTAHKRLCEIKGIGPWSADIFLLFCIGHPDIFPSGDLALQIAVQETLNLDKRPSARELDKIAVSWTPYRSVAARLFWAWYGAKKKNKQMTPV